MSDSSLDPAKPKTLAEKVATKTPPRWLIPWISRTHVALYKLTSGRIGAKLAGKPGVLIRTIGAKSGNAHTVCLPFLPDNGDRILIASYGGGPTNPAWYYNLKANPDVVVRDRSNVVWCRAEVVGPEERVTLWPKVVADSPWYGDYQTRTDRQIPLVRLRETGPYTS